MGQPVRFGFEEDKLGIAGKITGIDPRGDPQTRLVNVRADITDMGWGGRHHVRLLNIPQGKILCEIIIARGIVEKLSLILHARTISPKLY